MRGDGWNQLQIPLKNIFRMTPLSAQSISLDSPFNIYNLFEKEKTTLKVCTIEKIAVAE
jgi:chloramphenicol O-acetyltransferase